MREDKKNIANKEINFVCPMHPEVTSVKAKPCPKCNMQLVSIKDLQSNTKEHNCCG